MANKLTLLGVSIAMLLAACAPTQEVREVAPAGFLQDYSMLRPGQEGEVALVYKNPNANFAAYHKVMIDLVTVWMGQDSQMGEVPAEDRQNLANSLHNKVVAALQSDYQIVTTPGPGVLRVSAAITGAKQRKVALDTISTVVPMVRAISQLRSMATGTQSFVGEASVEGKITDAQSGDLLFAGVDRRGGGKTLTKEMSSWADVDAAFDYWAQKLRYRLCQESGRESCIAPA
jgi:hypothetical protein